MRLDHITPKQLYVVCYVASYRCNINFITVFKLGLKNSGDSILNSADLDYHGKHLELSILSPYFFKPTGLLGNNSVLDPPDPIPNSEVKRNCADDSVGSPHVKVGHCQALIQKPRTDGTGLFLFRSKAMTCYHNTIKVIKVSI